MSRFIVKETPQTLPEKVHGLQLQSRWIIPTAAARCLTRVQRKIAEEARKTFGAGQGGGGEWSQSQGTRTILLQVIGAITIDGSLWLLHGLPSCRMGNPDCGRIRRRRRRQVERRGREGAGAQLKRRHVSTLLRRQSGQGRTISLVREQACVCEGVCVSPGLQQDVDGLPRVVGRGRVQSGRACARRRPRGSAVDSGHCRRR